MVTSVACSLHPQRIYPYVPYCMWQVLAPVRSKIFDGSIEFIARRCRRLHTFSFIPGQGSLLQGKRRKERADGNELYSYFPRALLPNLLDTSHCCHSIALCHCQS